MPSEEFYKYRECSWCPGFAEYELFSKDTAIHGHESVAQVCECCAKGLSEEGEYLVEEISHGYCETIEIATTLGWNEEIAWKIEGDINSSDPLVMQEIDESEGDALEFIREKFLNRNS